MATVSGTLKSYDLVGVKEDVSDIISNISPTKTPYQASIGSESIHNITHTWQEDSLLPPATTAAIEGADAPTPTAQATVPRSNNTQILTKTAMASGTADAIKKYGRGKELAYQLGMRATELKRDMERVFIGTGQTAVIGSDNAARSMAGYQAQCLAANIYTAGTGGGLNFTGTTPSAGALTEAAVLGLSQQLYSNGAEPSMLLVKPSDHLKVAAFQQAGRTKYIDNADTKITNTLTVYESPFGTLRVMNDRFIRGGISGDSVSDALIYEPDMWKRLTLRDWQRETLAKTGDATKVQILGEFSLKHRNFNASGYITNLSA